MPPNAGPNRFGRFVWTAVKGPVPCSMREATNSSSSTRNMPGELLRYPVGRDRVGKKVEVGRRE